MLFHDHEDIRRTQTQTNGILRFKLICIQDCHEQAHEKLIDKAKVKLASTELSVSEIAYHFGFEFPQSFSKLFKSKTRQTPLEYRQSVN